MKFWQDRVADIGLLALGIALPCGAMGYFSRASEASEAFDAVEVEAVEVETGQAVAANGAGEVRPAVVDLAAPSSGGDSLGEDPAASALASRARALLSADAGVRAETAHWLSHLDNELRAAIVARLAELSEHRPASAEVARVFEELRRDSAKGDEPDLAVAAAKLLERERTPIVLAVVEPLLYLRSLETMVGAEGHAELARFIDLDSGVWEPELVRARARLGVSFAPALLGMRSHENPSVRRFAAAQLAALGGSEPKAVLSDRDPFIVARAIGAYASPPDYAAMPSIVRLVGDERIQVREAARKAVARLGRNAVWKLRELYDEVSGQPADKRWDHQRTAQELYAVLDRPRVEEAETLLARGLQSLTRGELEGMRRDFDVLLAKYPDFERRDRLAEGYAALGADRFRRDALTAALAAYRRALRLAPSASEAKRWQAQVAFVAAELSLMRGVVDLTGYARALELDPTLRGARDAIERLSGTRTQQERDMRRLAAILALAMLVAAVALLLKRGPTDRTRGAGARTTLRETKSESSS